MSDSTRDSLLDILLDVQSGRATVYEGADRVEATRKSDSTPVEAEGARDALHWAMKYALTVPTDQIVLVLSCALGNAQCGPLCDTLMGVILNREAALRARIETLEGALRQIIREREEDPMQSGDPNVMLCAWCEDDVTKHADGCACAIARRALGTPLKGGAP